MENYNTFLSNMLKREKYKIILKDDTEIIGIPTCGSFQKPDESSEFSIIVEDADGNKQTIKNTFLSIKNIEKIK